MKKWRAGKLIFDLLGSSLRFVNRENSQQNKSRWKTIRFWEWFLGAVEPLKLAVDMPLSSLYDTQKWLADGGVLSAIRAFLFLEEHHVLEDLKEMEELME